MKKTILLFVIFMALFSAGISMAEERYRGIHIVNKDGKWELDDKEYVELVIDKDIVKSIKIHINAASKDLTFSSCRKLEDDGSNFTKWFSLKCRNLNAFDNTPFTYDYFLIGAYAGISPIITPTYAMYKEIKDVSEQLGISMPSRTFVIYVNREPIYEFFCYPETMSIGKGKQDISVFAQADKKASTDDKQKSEHKQDSERGKDSKKDKGVLDKIIDKIKDWVKDRKKRVTGHLAHLQEV